MDSRLFFQQGEAVSALATVSIHGQGRTTRKTSEKSEVFPVNGTLVPDDGWHLWIDEQARWIDDPIHLPETFDLAALPSNAPTGGWSALDAQANGRNCMVVTLPSTVEQHFWGGC
jgi:beta-galactosidase